MKKFWNAHILLKLLFPLMLGIGLSSMVNTQNESLIWLGFVATLLLSIVAAVLTFRSRFKWLGGILIMAAFLCFGFVNYQLQQTRIPQFIENYKAEKQPFTLKVLEEPVIKERSIALLGQIQKHPNKELIGQKAMIYLARNRGHKINKGDVLLTTHFLNEIAAPKNPHEFDYRLFMQNKRVLYQTYLNNEQSVQILSGKAVKPNLIQGIRNIGFVFVEKNISENNQAVAKALLFGYRDELSRETSQEFAKAGTMHILAVSGLHVGIIFLLTNSLLQFINRKVKLPKWVTVMVLTSIIWLFVFLTGAKASVIRAGIMFSLFVIGLHFFPKNYSLNTLALAAIVLLTLTPSNLFDVGFQLSFSAVAGILLIVPTLQALVPIPKWKVVKYFLDITYVSIAAQLVTLPFAIYYFQQLPLLGVFTNLVAIPLAFAIVTVGFVGFLLSAVAPIAILLGQVLDFFLWCLQSINTFISDLSIAAVHHLYLTIFQAFFLFAAVASVAIMMKVRNTIYLRVSLTCLVLLAGSVAINKWQVENKQEFTIYSINNNVVVQVQNGREVNLFAKNQITDESFQFNILPNLKANYSLKRHFYTLEDSVENEQFSFKKQTFLLPNENIQFAGDVQEVNPSVKTIILDRQDYKQLYQVRDLAEDYQIILANTYPSRIAPDSLENLHFLQTEGYFQQ